MLPDVGRWRDLLLGPKPYQAPEPTRRRVATSPLTFQLNAPEALFDQLTGVSDGAMSRRVSRAEAMSVPAVKRARDLICGTLGTLPVNVHNRKRERVESHLMEQPEPDVARTVTMTRIIEDMLFEGRSWLRITGFAATGFPSQVRRLEPRSVQVRENSRVYVSRDGTPQGGAFEHVPDELLIRIDSPNDPLLVAGARAIRAALLLDQTAARNAKDPMPLGYFAPREGADVGDKEEIEEYLDDWEDSRQRRAWGYVGAALEAKTLQWNPEQLQLGTMRDHAVLEIARMAGVDPEDLGVSTTSRTYANAEQRRLDLLDFTLAAYVAAFESRMSMNDVTPRGHHVRFQYAGFLRSDTKTRMETYKLGREVGVYNDERIAELEDIPSATPPRPAPQPAPSPEPVQQHQEATVHQLPKRDPVNFSTPVAEAEAHVSFVEDERIRETFRVNAEKRTISGLAVPWDQVAPSGFSRWKFREGSLRWSDESRIKMLVDHDMSQPIGRAVRLQSTRQGLDATFKIARGAEGDRVLALAEDGVLDGMSVGIFFGEADDWQPDPSDESVRLVNHATLREVSITAMPAFDGARVASVVASQKGSTAMADTTVNPKAGEPATPESPDYAAFAETFGTKISETIGDKIAEAFANLQFPPEQREVVPAGRAVVTREAPVYAMNGHGHSMVRDAWKSRTEGDRESRERLDKFAKQLQDAHTDAMQAVQFGANTTSHGDIIPPGYRPDLYVTQLMRGRPLAGSLSRGTLSDATPFTLPEFVSSTGLTGDHTEGTNPTDGTIDVNSRTVTPGAISGLFTITREIADSSNPAIDAIATQAMAEAYSQQTEAKIYTELNGANGQGGTVTGGFVPSGAQVTEVESANGSSDDEQGRDLLRAYRSSLARYAFDRFADPDGAHVSRTGTNLFSQATDTTGRPLLPPVGAQNASGLGNAVRRAWSVDGLDTMPTWSMTGNASGDADLMFWNRADVWYWESPLLTFRFEERGGPANIDLALFGYFAVRLLRPVGLAAVRHTVAAV